METDEGIHGWGECVGDKAYVIAEAGRSDEHAAERVGAVREAGGDAFDSLLDFHGRVSPAMAIQMEAAMREFHPFFIEEPVLPENADALAQVARQFKTPIATGERLLLKWGFR